LPGGAAKVGPKLRDTDLVGRLHPHRIAVLSQPCRGPRDSQEPWVVDGRSLAGRYARREPGPGIRRPPVAVPDRAAARCDPEHPRPCEGGEAAEAATTSAPPSGFPTVDSSAGRSPRPMGKFLMKAPLASASTLNWVPACWPGLDVDHQDRHLLAAERADGAGLGVVLPSVKHRSPLTVPHRRACRRRRQDGPTLIETSEVTEGGRHHAGWNRQMV
jgi:hypothetical protein